MKKFLFLTLAISTFNAVAINEELLQKTNNFVETSSANPTNYLSELEKFAEIFRQYSLKDLRNLKNYMLQNRSSNAQTLRIQGVVFAELCKVLRKEEIKIVKKIFDILSKSTNISSDWEVNRA